MFKHLVKDIKRHYWQYLILFIGIASGSTVFLLADMPFFKAITVMLIGLFYFFWGTIHHILNRDWRLKISLEYLLIAGVACGLLLSMVLRG